MKNVRSRVVVAACSLAVLACVGALTAVEPAAPTTATGEGRIHFGADGDGIGYFLFDVQKQGNAVSGSLQFAGEHHEGYPDIVIKLDDVDEAKISRESARFSGKGLLHGDSVIVRASVRDGDETGDPDYFQVSCADGDGHVVFEAHGDLVAGDIVVGTPN